MPNNNEPPKKWKGTVVLVAIFIGVFAALGALASMQPGASQSSQITFSDFLDKLEDDKVELVTISEKRHQVTAKLTNGDIVTSNYPADFPLTQRLELMKVQFAVAREGSGSGSGWMIFAFVVGIIVVLFLLNRSRNGGGKAANGAPGRMLEVGEVDVTFNDVAGCDEVVEELAEIKEFLSDPERFRELGASIPKGVLLFGPPGTGKTLLARAVAGEAGVPFFSISGSDFVEMYVGVGASRVRKLFEAAKSQAPCVVFIDEIDAVGRRRSGNAQGGQEERENTLNQLLVEIDGFAPTDNVIVMAASNRVDILDPALTRPGRFDRQVIVDSPDRQGRLEILKIHGKGKPFREDVTLEAVASQTAGFNGADLANLVNEAALLTARAGRKEITPRDMDEAIMRVLAGPQKNRLISDKEKRTIATHEIGHAIMAHVLSDAEPVHKVTIIGRGRALGLMVSLQEEDRLLRSRGELLSRMAVALGGRVAEEIVFGEITTGAANDLEAVNEIAQAMVLHYGMSDNFATRALVHHDQLIAHSDALKEKIDAEVDSLVTEAKQITRERLEANREMLDHLSNILIERETIDRDEFETLMSGGKLAPLIRDWTKQERRDWATRPFGVFDARAASGYRDISESSAEDAEQGAEVVMLFPRVKDESVAESEQEVGALGESEEQVA